MPLFLVGDETSSDFLLSFNANDCDGISEVVIAMTCAQASGYFYAKTNSSLIGIPTLNAPTLVLDLCSSDSASRIWRSNPNIVAVQVDGRSEQLIQRLLDSELRGPVR